ncbi:MAG: hypothetical protein KJ718_01990 [Nanoarchaeota archaeon]|nr:hypothetical protein [Nanoarchaeota archaeon]MBU1051305.1 hypothetical protein [Nanoarchaeota archaeon]MBU1988467.1 hypothetical protein [Nanoarchaeota archaeon]
MELNELKKEYAKLAKTYGLPSFNETDKCFEISKIDKESDTLLRAIRKVMMEKIVNSLGFVEMLLNPMNAPRMYLAYIKSIGFEDKKAIEKIYGTFADLSVVSLEREVDYGEKEEAELIKKIIKTWNELKPEFRKILKNMKKPNNDLKKRERSYFG